MTSSTRTTGPPASSRAPAGATASAPARLSSRCRELSPDWSATARRCRSTPATRAGTPRRRSSPAAASAIRRAGSCPRAARAGAVRAAACTTGSPGGSGTGRTRCTAAPHSTARHRAHSTVRGTPQPPHSPGSTRSVRSRHHRRMTTTVPTRARPGHPCGQPWATACGQLSTPSPARPPHERPSQERHGSSSRARPGNAKGRPSRVALGRSGHRTQHTPASPATGTPTPHPG